MGVTTERFIRKPLYVDAVRVKADNFDEIVRWCQGEVQTDEVPGTGTTKKYIKVRVHNPKNPRQTKAFIGDWILYTDRGYKVYTNKAFRAAFDLVPGVEPTVQEMPPTRLGEGKQFGDAPVDLDSPLTEDEEVEVAEEEPERATAEQIREGLPNAQDKRKPVDEHHTPQGEPHEYVEATPEAIADVVNEQQPPEEPVVEETPIAPPPTPAIVPPEVAPEPRLQTETGDDHKLKHEPVGLNEADADRKIEQAGQPEPVSEQAPEDAAAGKRVLSHEEQRQMGPDAVREMVRTGDVILAQDLAESA